MLQRALAGLLLLSLPASAVAAGNPFATVDAQLAGIGKQLDDLKTCRGESDVQVKPPPPVKVAVNVPKPKPPLSPAQREAACVKEEMATLLAERRFQDWGLDHLRDLEPYFECVGIAEKTQNGCSGIERLDVARSTAPVAALCRANVGLALTARAIITHDPNAEAICRANEGGRVGMCRSLLAHVGDAKAVCADAIKAGVAIDPERCPVILGMFWGDPAACGVKQEGEAARICPDLAAFRAAKTGGGSAACGRSGICSAMLGRPAGSACAGYLRGPKAAYCKSVWETEAARKDYETSVALQERAYQAAVMTEQVKETARQRAAFDVRTRMAMARPAATSCSLMVDNVRKSIDQAIGMLDHMEPKSIRGFEERRERIAAFQERLAVARKRALTPVNREAGPKGGEKASGSQPASGKPAGKP